MSIKESLLELFENNRGRFVSGNEIAEEFDVSRTAVWKTVKSLINDGHRIEAAGSKGYRMLQANEVMSKSGIVKYLQDGKERFCFEIYDTVGSTNDVLKEKALTGAEEGTVVIASAQTQGKGRMGRPFLSPDGTGVYFSVLLRPKLPLEEVTLITAAAAVAVCRAVDRIAEVGAGIKWVNDIFVDGKKCAGILTEASFGGESGALDYVVLGIGSNLYTPEEGFPKEIADTAGAFFKTEVEDCRNRIIAFILEEFFYIYDDFKNKDFVKEYIKRSIVMGKEILITGPGGKQRFAEVMGIDPYCRLEVMMEDGSVEFLNSGEISIRTAR